MVYILSKDIVIAKGFLRSAIYDLTREDYDFITNEVADILNGGVDIPKLPLNTLTWLKEKEYILFVPKKVKNNITSIDLQWDSPSIILTMSTSINVFFQHLEKFIEIIQKFNVKSMALFNFVSMKSESIEQVLVKLEKTNVQVVELLTDENKNINYKVYIQKYKKIKSIIVYNSQIESEMFGNDGFGNIIHKKSSFEKREKYRQHPSYFNVNTELVTESLHFNSYFNRRLHISKDGSIFQSPISTASFGELINYNVNELTELILSKPFNENWVARKDITDVCKDCEHRYMCSDNRKPIKRNRGGWYHGIECNYNPYIAKWSMESNYKKLLECGIVNNNEKFEIDIVKLNEITKIIWDR